MCSLLDLLQRHRLDSRRRDAPTGRRASSDDSQMSSASSIGPVPSATARSTTLRSSRTLPGQWYSSIFLQRRRREAADLPARLADEALQEVLGQQRHVARALAQRRHADLDHLQAEEQVAAERARPGRPAPAAGWSPPRRARRPGSACCRRPARTGGLPARAATWPACRRSSRRSRRGRSCRGRPPRTCRPFFSVAPVNAPFSWPNSSLSSSVSVRAAQLRQTNGPSLARAGVVDGPGDQFLADAALAADQHGRVGAGHPADLALDLARSACCRRPVRSRRAAGRAASGSRPSASACLRSWCMTPPSCLATATANSRSSRVQRPVRGSVQYRWIRPEHAVARTGPGRRSGWSPAVRRGSRGCAGSGRGPRPRPAWPACSTAPRC